MPIQPNRQLLTLFGFVIWGDIAELTTYRRPDGRLVVFKKTYPDKPPSPQQTVQRQKLTNAAAAWTALTPAEQSQWTAAAAKANLTMHGYDLWIYWKLTQDENAIRTLQRQTNTTLIT